MCMFFVVVIFVFFFKQKTADEMRISDWSFRRVLFRSRRQGLSDVVHTEGRDAAVRRRGSCRRRGGAGAGSRFPRIDALGRALYRRQRQDRKSDVSGKGVSVRVDIGGRRINKKKN